MKDILNATISCGNQIEMCYHLMYDMGVNIMEIKRR